MKIGEKNLDNNLMFAPLAGVSDIGLRSLCSNFGADVTFSEMLSARGIIHSPKRTYPLTLTSESEKIKIAQIFGKEPSIMAEALNSALISHFDGIDINMGCPAPKIVKNGEGSALMKDPLLASRVISACVKATNRPVSVKMRLGFDKIIATDFARMCEESGASFITVHGRTQNQLFSGQVDLEEIAKVKASVKIPVVGNGDVVSRESYINMLQTGVDAVMIGRGAMGKPWIFKEILGEEVKINVYELAREHVRILRQHYDEKWLKLYMRKHFLWYVSNIQGASKYRAELATSNDVDRSLEILKEIFN